MHRFDAHARLACVPTLKTDSGRSRRAGVGLTVLGTVCFSGIDGGGKWLGGRLPDAFVVAGALVVVASGLCLLALERKRR